MKAILKMFAMVLACGLLVICIPAYASRIYFSIGTGGAAIYYGTPYYYEYYPSSSYYEYYPYYYNSYRYYSGGHHWDNNWGRHHGRGYR